MTDNTNNDRMNRRTVLKIASSVTASGLLAAPASGEPTSNFHGVNHGFGYQSDPDGDPDIILVDSSRSSEKVQIQLREVRQNDIISEMNASTTGLNHPNTSITSNGSPPKDSVMTVGKIITGFRGLIKVVVKHQGFSDSAIVFVGENGATSGESVSIQIEVDEAVSVATSISCDS